MCDYDTGLGVLVDLLLYSQYKKYLMGFVGTCKKLYFPEERIIKCSGINDIKKNCSLNASYVSIICKFTDISNIRCYKCRIINEMLKVLNDTKTPHSLISRHNLIYDYI